MDASSPGDAEESLRAFEAYLVGDNLSARQAKRYRGVIAQLLRGEHVDTPDRNSKAALNRWKRFRQGLRSSEISLSRIYELLPPRMSASQASDMTDRAMEDVRASRGDKAWAHESEYRSAISKLFHPLVTGGAKPEQLAFKALHNAVIGHVTVFLHKPETRDLLASMSQLPSPAPSSAPSIGFSSSSSPSVDSSSLHKSMAATPPPSTPSYRHDYDTSLQMNGMNEQASSMFGQGMGLYGRRGDVYGQATAMYGRHRMMNAQNSGGYDGQEGGMNAEWGADISSPGMEFDGRSSAVGTAASLPEGPGSQFGPSAGQWSMEAGQGRGMSSFDMDLERSSAVGTAASLPQGPESQFGPSAGQWSMEAGQGGGMSSLGMDFEMRPSATAASHPPVDMQIGWMTKQNYTGQGWDGGMSVGAMHQLDQYQPGQLPYQHAAPSTPPPPPPGRSRLCETVDAADRRRSRSSHLDPPHHHQDGARPCWSAPPRPRAAPSLAAPPLPHRNYTSATAPHATGYHDDESSDDEMCIDGAVPVLSTRPAVSMMMQDPRIVSMGGPGPLVAACANEDPYHPPHIDQPQQQQQQQQQSDAEAQPEEAIVNEHGRLAPPPAVGSTSVFYDDERMLRLVHARAPPNVWGVCVGHTSKKGHPLVIGASAVHVPMAQSSSLLINGVDVGALDQARPMFDALHAAQLQTLQAVGIDTRAIKNLSCPIKTSYHGAQVAWSWLRAHEGIITKFLGSGRRVMSQHCLSRVEMKLRVMPMGSVANGASAAVASAVAMVAHLWGRNVSGRYCVTGSLDLRGRVTNVGSITEKLRAFGQGEFVQHFLYPLASEREAEEARRTHVGWRPIMVPISTIWEALEMMLEGEKPTMTPLEAMQCVLLEDKVNRGWGEAATVAAEDHLDGWKWTHKQAVQVCISPGSGRWAVTGAAREVIPAQTWYALDHLMTDGREAIKAAVGEDEVRVEVAKSPDDDTVQALVDVHVHFPTYSWSQLAMHWVGITIALAMMAAMTRRATDPNAIIIGALNDWGALTRIGAEALSVTDVLLAQQAGFSKVLLPEMPPEGHPALQLAASYGMQVVEVESLSEALSHVLLPLPSPPRTDPPATSESSEASGEGEEGGPQ